MERKKGGKGVYFLHQQLVHSILLLWKERCLLTVTSLVSLAKIDTHPLDDHSHCLVLYSVLTSMCMFYWLNRGVNSSKTGLPKSLSAIWLQEVVDTASPWSLLLQWLEEKGACSQAALNQATQGAHRSNPALRIAPRRKRTGHWGIDVVCSQFN